MDCRKRMADLLDAKEIGKNPTFSFYSKKIPHKNHTTLKSLSGLSTGTTREIHENVGMNQFLKKKTGVPKGFNKIKTPEEKWMKKYFYDPSRTPIVRNIVPELKKK